MHKNFVYIRQQGQEGEADRTTDYERNAFGQVTCVRDALGGEEFYCYDALGPGHGKDRPGRAADAVCLYAGWQTAEHPLRGWQKSRI